MEVDSASSDFVVTEERLKNYQVTAERPEGATNPRQCKGCQGWTKQYRFMFEILITVGMVAERVLDPKPEL